MDEWFVIDFEVFGFVQLSADDCFGVTPYGRVVADACASLSLQLVSPAPDVIDFESEEVMLQRIGPWRAQRAGSEGSVARR